MMGRRIAAFAMIEVLSATSFLAETRTFAAPATCEARKVSQNVMKSLCLYSTPGNGHYAEAHLQFDGYAAYRHSDTAPMGIESISGVFHGGYISQRPWPVVVR